MRQLIDLTGARAVYELLHDPMHLNKLLKCLAAAMQFQKSYFSKLPPGLIVKIAQYNCQNTYLDELSSTNKWGFWYHVQRKLNAHLARVNVRQVIQNRVGNQDSFNGFISNYLRGITNDLAPLHLQFTAAQKQHEEFLRKRTILPMYQAQQAKVRCEVEDYFDIESQQVHANAVRKPMYKVE